MSYSATILADSVSPAGGRLTTMELVYPRFIHAEMLRHRSLSHSVASNRALPPEKQIAQVMENPFVPETFNARVKGMGVGAQLSEDASRTSRDAWLYARDSAVNAAHILIDQDVDKSRVNRLLEPFQWLVEIVSGTEWSNFFALRDHPAAQPEFQTLARLMRETMEGGVPQQLDYGQWHLPLITDKELIGLCAARTTEPTEVIDRVEQEYKMVSARRCAAISFEKHRDPEPWEASIEKCYGLLGSRHFSPTEHVARPAEEIDMPPWAAGNLPPSDLFFGNFKGWFQMRKEMPFEDDFGAADRIKANA